MEKHYSYTDSEFEQHFHECTLPSEMFTHEAHLRLAWIEISKYGVDTAIENISAHIKKYAESLDAADKFHATVTVAAVEAVHHFMKKTESETFQGFISTNPELKTRFKELLSSHYSFNVFESEKAKQKFIEPDVSSFRE
ncbi:MAG: hypothetical protein JJ971_12875 [Balneolaceae bacterium]|nr:hypothetical protein [Balneolaceae bacterium]MBO6547254.1 hypothetical protein [Balneolaceae bacterium]MBO6647799.1 hypothetical protein [Balneolaceae bacterium]